MKLSTKKFSMAAAITWGLYILLIGWAATAGWGNHQLVTIISSLYVGFKPTFFGSLIGCAWGILDGLIGGYIFVKLGYYIDILARLIYQ